MCTPTRCALLTGKYPIRYGMHHGVVMPLTPFGLPPELTLLPQKLKKAGYATHIVGKWHLGYFEWQYTPTYRGFDTFYGFYNGAEDKWSHKRDGILDLRDQKSPVTDMNNVYSTNLFVKVWYTLVSYKRDGILDLRDQKSPVTDMNNVYSTNLFVKRTEQIIESHNSSVPLFLYLSLQNVHSPIQAPVPFINKYDFIEDPKRRIHAGMISAVDEAIGNVTSALRNKGLWDNTLMVFSTDNGGMPTCGGYNWPLRGCKATLWEGGVRGAAFVHGSMIEKKGRKCKELLHVTDWFPTLTSLAGLSDSEEDALDGFNVWDTISKDDPSPRTEILHNIDVDESGDERLSFDGIALRVGHMKIIMSVLNHPWFKPPELKIDQQHTDEDMTLISLVLDSRGSQKDQDRSQIERKDKAIKEALFNITADPEERHDLSAKFPDIVAKLKERVDFYRKGVVKMRNQRDDPEALASAKRNGVWGPWRGLE
ncbi:hypothetical protein QZH41_012039 [Actinostola sp. cb2023]|nr:hypothetical protein QZH41_012039 [Actinostola sp. cb2023]